MTGVYSVTQVNSYIKNMFTQDFLLRRISVKGEVSNCKYHSSGHIYFTLKDKGGTISAIMFAGNRRGLSFKMEEGMQVVVKGSVEVYERDGKYQLYAIQIEQEGQGDLYRRFQELLKELEEMGMFDAGYKRPIPRYAKNVGIVTAKTGAAIRDIMNISHRRNPYVQLILYPALVQGDGAKESIVRGIETLDAMGLDVLIVGRGGGSIEDLWAFNEELVARAIFSCKTPVISAVGHETDITIADYVADLRAPTPSAAAELAVFDYAQFQSDLDQRKKKLDKEITNCFERARHRLKNQELTLRFYDPKSQLNEKKKRLADAETKLLRAIAEHQKQARHNLQTADTDLRRKMTDRLKSDEKRLAIKSERLWGFSPLKRISSGYGFLTDAAGKRIESALQVACGDPITVRVKDGRIEALVKEIKYLEEQDS